MIWTDLEQRYLELSKELDHRAEHNLPLWDQIMPNGKPLRECTRDDLRVFARQFRRISEKARVAKEKLANLLRE